MNDKIRTKAELLDVGEVCLVRQCLAGLIIRVPPRIASAITPGAIASQLPAAAKPPVAAQVHDESASAIVAMREEV